jgi:hypothetical protein
MSIKSDSSFSDISVTDYVWTSSLISNFDFVFFMFIVAPAIASRAAASSMGSPSKLDFCPVESI